MTKRIACLFVLAIALVGLAGCPKSSDPLTPVLHTKIEGQQAMLTLDPIDEVNSPDGALVTFEGGNGFKEAEATIYLNNVPNPIVQKISRAQKAAEVTAEKCLSCGAVTALALATIGITVGTVAIVNESNDSFDIAVPGGDNLVTCIMRVVGNDGTFSIITFRGRAYNGGTPTGKYHLSWEVSPAGAGGVTANPDQEEYNPADKVSLTAVANTGYVFDHWVVNGVESAWRNAEAEVSMDSDSVQVIAVFKTVTDTSGCTLVTNVTPTGAGSVSVDPDKAEYSEGEKVTVKATANTGYTFLHWSVNGTLGTTATVAEVTMSSPKVTVTAVFGTSSTADTTAPVITLRGSATVNLTLGTAWTDPGATALDNVDGDISARIAINGGVNVNAVGNYVVSYNVQDVAGNRAIEVRRTVFVEDTGSTNKMVIAVTSDANGVLSYTVTNGPANGTAGLELYQSSAPNIQRNTTETNTSGSGSGVLSNFRANLSRTLRCTAVLHRTTGAWVPNENVRVTLNGSIMPLVADKDGNWAFQASF